MIIPVEMYGAQCDHCKKDWECEGSGFTAMSCADSIQEMLSEADWHTGDGKEGKTGQHSCPDCWTYDDEDNFILDPKRKDKHLKD